MNLKVGIVGLPNVGKSTLFNALLGKQQALAANYPFATIEPNVGVVPVPDERLGKLAEVVNTEQIVPATVEFVDIAGLVKGAASGEGLGNKFLAHIREVDLVCHVLRHFGDALVIREGAQEPEADYLTVQAELILKDLETITAQKEKTKSPAMEGKLKNLILKLFDHLNAGKPARTLTVSSEEKEMMAEWFLLSAKEEIGVINIDEDQLSQTEEIQADYSQKLGFPCVALNAKLESELASLGKADAAELMGEYGIDESGLNRLIKMAYQKLGLISFLTAGEKEVRAWTVKQGTDAPQAAGVIHTDFTKNFIKAKVVSYDDFIEFTGWKNAAEKGKVRLEGREYIIREGDVVEFMIGG
jgi:GTP-binding protein YchF